MKTGRTVSRGVALTFTLYGELRKLAAHRLRQHEVPVTLQATALVHEAWIRIGADNQPDWENRAHFFSSVARTMRDILVDRARRRQRIRHGGKLKRVDLDESAMSPIRQMGDTRLLDLNEALDELENTDADSAMLVNLRYFAGMTVRELAEHTQQSIRTTERRLRYAHAWLGREIKRNQDS